METQNFATGNHEHDISHLYSLINSMAQEYNSFVIDQRNLHKGITNKFNSLPDNEVDTSKFVTRDNLDVKTKEIMQSCNQLLLDHSNKNLDDFNAVTTRVSDLEGKIKEADLPSIKNNISDHKTSIDHCWDTLSEVASLAGSNRSRVEELEAATGNHLARLDGHDKTLSNHAELIKKHGDEILSNRKGIESNSSAITGQGLTLAQLNEYTKKIDNCLSNFQKDVQVELEPLIDNQKQLYENITELAGILPSIAEFVKEKCDTAISEYTHSQLATLDVQAVVAKLAKVEESARLINAVKSELESELNRFSASYNTCMDSLQKHYDKIFDCLSEQKSKANELVTTNNVTALVEALAQLGTALTRVKKDKDRDREF